MITSECLCRVLRFEVGNASGSCFSYEQGNRQFLITAKHIFENVGYPSQCTAYFNLYVGKKAFNINVYYHTNINVDIAIMEVIPQNQLTLRFLQQQYSIEDMVLGQDVFFLGFPLDFCANLSTPQGDNPMPFVKKACFSGTTDKDGVNIILLDGINNPGFSGGPVCFKKIHNETCMSIAGVINGYRTNISPLIDDNAQVLPYAVRENTGIIIATNIKHAIEIINTIP